MGDRTGIEWTEATWNPLRGCSRVSEGCRNCYAEAVASRFSGEGMPYEGLARKGKWTGKIRFVQEALDRPLRWRRPRRIFVNSMSDLFHEQVHDAWIAAIFAVMFLAGQHTYQILTKRPERMREWMRWLIAQPDSADVLLGTLGDFGVDAGIRNAAMGPWPKPHIWLGVSVEDQATADERIPVLLETPAALRWVSYEPALGPVDFKPRPEPSMCLLEHPHAGPCRRSGLDWIVVGGESGSRARPFNVKWGIDVVGQAVLAGVPVFVKQLGSRPGFRLEDEEARGNPMPSFHHFDAASGLHIKAMNDRKGGDPAEWPEELRVREWPRA